LISTNVISQAIILKKATQSAWFKMDSQTDYMRQRWRDHIHFQGKRVTWCVSSNDKIRVKAEKYLNELAAGSKEDTEALIIEVLRVYHPTLYTKIQSFDDLAENIDNAFKIFKGEIRTNQQLGAKFAVKLTESLTRKKASQLTGYHHGTLQRANLKKEPTTTLNKEKVK
jgi:hypothetical protein